MTVTPALLDRFTQLSSETNDAKSLLQFQRENDRLYILTGARYVQGACLLTRVFGVFAVLGGFMLLPFVAWGIALSAGGALAFLLAPRLFRPSKLLELNVAEGALIVAPPLVSAGTRVCFEQVCCIRGVYEIYGWNAHSAVYVALVNGTQVPVLVFSGTDEPLAAYACRVLGFLLQRPATYSGPFGSVTTCYDPVHENQI